MTPEMIEKIRGCETDEERRAVLEENGIELDDEQLDGIAGGVFDSPFSSRVSSVTFRI